MDPRPRPEGLSANMRAAVALLEVFFVAILLAILGVPSGGQLLAAAIVAPFLVSTAVFIVYCRRRRAWGYAGAAVLGVLGIAVRVVVSTRPDLEPSGGLPPAVTAAYVTLGALVALTSYQSFLELRTSAGGTR